MSFALDFRIVQTERSLSITFIVCSLDSPISSSCICRSRLYSNFLFTILNMRFHFASRTPKDSCLTKLSPACSFRSSIIRSRRRFHYRTNKSSSLLTRIAQNVCIIFMVTQKNHRTNLRGGVVVGSKGSISVNS